MEAAATLDEQRGVLAAEIKKRTDEFLGEGTVLSDKAKAVKKAIADGGWDGREDSIYNVFSACLGEDLNEAGKIPQGVCVVEIAGQGSHNYGSDPYVLIDSRRAYGLRHDGTLGNHGPTQSYPAAYCFVENKYSRKGTDEEVDAYVAELPDEAVARLFTYLSFGFGYLD